MRGKPWFLLVNLKGVASEFANCISKHNIPDTNPTMCWFFLPCDTKPEIQLSEQSWIWCPHKRVHTYLVRRIIPALISNHKKKRACAARAQYGIESYHQELVSVYWKVLRILKMSSITISPDWKDRVYSIASNYSPLNFVLRTYSVVSVNIVCCIRNNNWDFQVCFSHWGIETE